MQKDVLILGGGVAGLQAALELTGAGYPVHLVTEEPALGGKLVNTQAVPKDPEACLWGSDQLNISALYLGGNLHTSTTVLGSLITRVNNEPLITVYCGAKLNGFGGGSGDFTAAIADIRTGKQQAEVKAGAVILAAGFSMFDARQKGEYGYGIYRNVVTSLEYENMLATNRLTGCISRPSDGKTPRKVAFIQCVGSRDAVSGGDYCSAICCMFTAKEAILTKEYQPETATTVFYLDLRSCGKNFDDFLSKARQLGTNYVRTMISEIKEDPVTENLAVKYLEDGTLRTGEYDLVVLATGIRPAATLSETAALLDIKLNKHGFVDVSGGRPVMTSRKGIFSIGGSQGPIDVSETLALANAAAQAGAALLGKVQPSAVKMKKDVADSGKDPARIGVLLCGSGLKTMGAEAITVEAAVKEIDGVVFTACRPTLCSTGQINYVEDIIREHKLNRLVISPCALKTNIHLFQEVAQRAGLNRMLVEVQSLPPARASNAEEAGRLATDAARKAIANVKTYKPLHWHAEPVIPSALIIGGGITGLTVASDLAARGFSTTILEKTGQLGGYVCNGKADGDDTQIAELISAATNNEKITVLTNAKAIDFKGHQGHFVTTVQLSGGSQPTTRSVEHGVLIVAIGTEETPTAEYLYGTDERIFMLGAADNHLSEEELSRGQGKTYVFIQCVGSRDAERPYCSRTCCEQTIAQALRIKACDLKAKVYVFYRDVRTPGYLELLYREARERGVLFVHYDETAKPVLQKTNDGTLVLTANDRVANCKLEIYPDKVFLAGAQKAAQDAVELANLLHLQINPQGFLTETHAGFGMIAFPGGGIYVAGSLHSPKSIPDCIIQAKGVAGRAAKILAQPFIRLGGIVAEVDAEKCAACLTCVRTCPFHIPEINRDKKAMGSASIAAADCRGCGLCTAECPNKAITPQRYSDEDLLVRLDALFSEVG